MTKRGPKPRPLDERILANIHIDEHGCWIWQLRRDRYGYGQIGIQRRPQRQTRRAHTVAYELWVGHLDPGLTIDHLCRNRGCCNPDHLIAWHGWAEPDEHLPDIEHCELCNPDTVDLPRLTTAETSTSHA